ncbi:aspartate aminotransferase family protein [Plantactinospora sp. GCM10030261]|uniref:aminotransferase family protein n=1 Tax=Plantactinospora sp. GCM10030261 TaxID=3273420 RepID=UPI00361ABAF4
MTISPTTATGSAASTELEALDRRHLIHPHLSADRADRSVIVRGKGCAVWDAHGTEFLDVTGGGNWLCQIGHGRPEIAEVAAEQAARLGYFTSFYEFTNDRSIELATRLVDLSPAGFDRVFFTNGGSEGVDSAIKAARLYHHRRGESDRTWVISRQFAYHGATYGSGTATGFEHLHVAIGPLLPHIERLTPAWPYHTELYGGQDPTDFLVAELEQTIERIGADKIAAMIGEPVMAGGGVHAPMADYWPRVSEVLHRHGILLIADEVVTAFGRTGAWFDSPQRGLSPDIIVTAKGLTSGYAPLGAVLTRDEVGETLVSAEGFYHGHTYFGHPVACAVGLANLDVLEKEALPGRAHHIADWLRSGLAPLRDLPAVGDVRVVGATAGIELVANRETHEPLMPPVARNAVLDLHRNHGVIARDYGNVITLSPPLVIDERQVGRAAAGLTEVLSRMDTTGRLTPR